MKDAQDKQHNFMSLQSQAASMNKQHVFFFVAAMVTIR